MKKIFLAFIITMSSSSYALVDVGGMIGVRKSTFSYQQTDNHVLGYDLMASAHISPLPLVPFAIGAVVLMQNASYKDETSDKTGSFTGLQYGIDAMAWIPIPIYSPYARVSYFLAGSHKAKVSGVGFSGRYDSSGFHIGLGINAGLLPFINLMFEINYGEQTLKPDSIKLAGLDVTSLADDSKVKGYAILGGIEVDL